MCELKCENKFAVTLQHLYQAMLVEARLRGSKSSFLKDKLDSKFKL